MRLATDNHRRLVCRIAFLLSCMLPTILVGYWVLHPTTSSDWEQRIQADLGLAVKIGRVETPRAGITELHNVQLLDDHEKTVGRVPKISVSRNNGNEVSISSGLELTSTSLAMLLQRLQARLSKSSRQHSTWHLKTGDTIIAIPDQELSSDATIGLSQAEVLINSSDRGSYCLLRFKFSEQSANQCVEFRLVRDDDVQRAGDYLIFKTFENIVPIWMLNGLGTDRFSFGRHAAFQGIVQLERRFGQWSGNVKGSVLEVDMSQFNTVIGSNISGTCRADILNLAIESDRIAQAELHVTSKEGELKPELLKAIGTLPNIEIQEAIDPKSNVHYYDLAIRMRLQDGSFTLFPAKESGLLLEGEHSALLRLDPAKPSQVDLEHLARTLVEPDSPAGLVDNKIVNFLANFNLPPISRSAQATKNSNSTRH